MRHNHVIALTSEGKQTPLTFSTPKHKTDCATLDNTIELLTPMIGGGVNPWEVDPEQPIRASEIKHHLRFWWRTMQDPTICITELRRRENEIFGDGQSHASKIRITVNPQSLVNDFCLSPIDLSKRPSYPKCPSYVLFPLIQGTLRPILKQGYTFQLIIDLTDLSNGLDTGNGIPFRQQVKNALELWLLLGGIGARTRRGAGSLYCKKIHDCARFATPALLATHLTTVAPHTIPAGSAPPSFPVLAGGKFAAALTPEAGDPVVQWEQFLESYPEIQPGKAPGFGSIRQAGGLARTKKFGPSRWPEAATLRKLCGVFAPAHDPDKPGREFGFPRAAYGMPLQIRFTNHKGTLEAMMDPAPNKDFAFNIMPKSGDRWPSPLTLKIGKFGEKVYKVALLLNQRIPPIRCSYDKNALAALLKAQKGKEWKLPEAEKSTLFGAASLEPYISPQNFPLARGTDPYTGILKALFPGQKPTWIDLCSPTP